MKIYDFCVEGKRHCIGLDVKAPRFSWKMQSNVQNTFQKAFDLKVMDGNHILWRNKSNGEKSVDITYNGESFLPRHSYTAEVCVVDNYGNSDTATVSFETGKLDEPFNAKYITASEDLPVYQLVKKITAKKDIVKGRLYATALGLYEFCINGKKVGDMQLTPFWTDYKHTLEYQTYDITELIKGGENELSMTIGKGWYAGKLGWMGEKEHYGKKTAGFAEIVLTYSDGTEEVICTDESWTAENSFIVDSEFYDGETQDYTMPKKQYAVDVIEAGEWRVIGQINEPVRTIETKQPISSFRTPNGEYVVDFGQNLSGFLRIKIEDSFSGKIKIKHAEVLDKNGNFYTENLRTAISEDTYTITKNQNELIPHFTFHGFRYAQIICDNPEKLKVEVCVIHSDMPKTGTFSCSHKKINQLQSNIVWGQRSNFIDVPTDCPQRDERLGWTGDINVFFRTASFNYNTELFFDKWLRDVRTEQGGDGNMPHVIPNILGIKSGASLWSDCATMIPWNHYQVYGSKTLLEKQFLSMKSWVDYVYLQCGNKVLWQTGFQYGDWLALDSGNRESSIGASDKYFVANVFYYHSTDIVAKTAKELGKLDYYEEYKERASRILRAIQKEYITATGRMVSETQTACALALYFNIVPKKFRERVVEALKNNLIENKNHLNTGFAGTPFLLHALSENGEHALATKLLFNEDYPSWLYAVNMGATTIWERWNGILPDGDIYDPSMNSFNHYSYGSVGDFLYRKVAGLNAGTPGYKDIIIKPNLTQNIEGAKAEYESIYGKIVCGYECRNGKIKVFAEIPANTRAEIILPETNEVKKVGSGSYVFEYDTKTDLFQSVNNNL